MAKLSTPPSPARHRTPTLEVTGSVVEAALRIIAAEGSDAVTVRRLAGEADVAPMTIYNRFGDMHGVFDAVFEHGFTVFVERLRVTNPSGDPVADLHSMGLAYRSFAVENPDLYEFMFLNFAIDLEPSDRSSLAAAQAFDVLSSLVSRALDMQKFRPASASVVAQQIWATCHGAVALELMGIAKFADPEETYNSLLITLLRGLLRNPEESAALA
jgi:AcrR family transcriptional regulator